MRKTDANIVVLTGAGISKESGIDTFRDKGGIWTQVSIEDVATPEAFQRDPERVLAFYDERRKQLASKDVKPNAAHRALVTLEKEWPGSVLVVTQNIDDLHDRAGQKNLLHMHGELLKARCLKCKRVHSWKGDIHVDAICPSCRQPSRLRPHIVWFGEVPLYMDQIQKALTDCGIFISVGTSGAVYPAAGFVQYARTHAGAHTVELNLEASAGSSLFDEHHHGSATEIVPTYVETLLGDGPRP